MGTRRLRHRTGTHHDRPGAAGHHQGGHVTVLETAAVAAAIFAWCLAGPVALVFVTTMLPGIAWDRIRARRHRAATKEDHRA